MPKKLVSDLQPGDKIILQAEVAVVKAIIDMNHTIPTRATNVNVIELLCATGPFRSTEGKCVMLSDEKVEVLPRASVLKRLLDKLWSFLLRH